MVAAGTVALTAGAVSKMAIEVGKGIASASQNVKAEALCQRVASRSSTMGYSALGIMAALALANATHGPHAYPRDPEPLEKIARVHMQEILQFVNDPVKLELLKIYPNHPDVRKAAAPALARLRVRQLRQMRDKLADAATALGKDAMLGAAMGLGFRGLVLASQMAELRVRGKPWIGVLVDEEQVVGKLGALGCSYFLNKGLEIPPILGTRYVIAIASLPPVVIQIMGLKDKSPKGLKVAKFFQVVSLFLSFGVLFGSKMNRILGNNASNEAKFAVGHLLLGAMALGITGSIEFGANFSQNLASRSISHDTSQAIRSLARQLFHCVIKNAALRGGASVASYGILRLLQRCNMNPNITQKYRFLLGISSMAAPLVSELLHSRSTTP